MGDEGQPSAFRRYVLHPDYGSARLLWCTIVGTVTTIAVPSSQPWRTRSLIGWDIGVLLLLAIDWRRIAGADARTTARRAASEDVGRLLVWLILLGVAFFSMYSAIFVLKDAQTYTSTARLFWSGLALLGVLLAWALTHTAFALRYAHLHYGSMHLGGFDFPGNKPPTELDFAYLAFTVGMTFATSDVNVTSTNARRAVLAHALVSFLYSVTILAIAIQLAFTWLGG